MGREMGWYTPALSKLLAGLSTNPLICSAQNEFAPPFALRQEIPKGSVGKGMGHFFGAMRIDGFTGSKSFKNQGGRAIATRSEAFYRSCLSLRAWVTSQVLLALSALLIAAAVSRIRLGIG
jgi:hypothetical protein